MKKALTIACASALLIATPFVFAKAKENHTIDLYAKPESHAKVIAKVNKNQNLVEIFQQNGWTKVGDPENGNTGWVKNTQLNTKVAMPTPGKVETITIPHYSQTVITAVTDKKGHTTYKVEQSGNQKKLTQQQAAAVFKHMHEQQQRFQAQMNRMMRQSFAAFNQPFFNNSGFFGPHFMNAFPPVEVVVVPPGNHVTPTPNPKTPPPAAKTK